MPTYVPIPPPSLPPPPPPQKAPAQKKAPVIQKGRVVGYNGNLWGDEQLYGQYVYTNKVDQITDITIVNDTEIKALQNPRAIAFDASGNMLIADIDTGLYLIPKTDGVFYGVDVSANWATQLFPAGAGVAADSSGNVYVSKLNDGLWHGSIGGESYYSFANTRGRSFIDLKVTSTGEVVAIEAFADASSSLVLFSISEETETLLYSYPDRRASCIAIDASDNVYVGLRDSYVERITPAGVMSVILTPDDYDASIDAVGEVTSIVLDLSHNLFTGYANEYGPHLLVLPAANSTIFEQNVSSGILRKIQAIDSYDTFLSTVFDAAGRFFFISYAAINVVSNAVPNNNITQAFFNAGGSLIGGRNYTLVEDISINPVDNPYLINAISIGGNTGSLDGSGHTITVVDYSDYPGLVQSLGMGAIRNLQIDASGSTTLGQYAGWFGECTGPVENCISTGDIPFSGGGIVGMGYSGTIINCKSYGNITGEYAGGIAGSSASNVAITGCTSEGAISYNTGGIVGPYSSNVSITDCSSSGDIGIIAGGIIGNNSTNIFIENCNSSGSINTFSGGLAGNNCVTVTIQNSTSTGDISGDWAGGIVGYFTSGSITDCSSSGIIIGANTGGIAGPTSSCLITSCYSIGDISGSAAGGICASSQQTDVSGCYSTGTIRGDGAGGILGEAASAITVYKCYSTGSISGVGAGGIIGIDAYGTTIDKCYSLGDISGGGSAGGIAGSGGNNITVEGSYTKGNIYDISSAAFFGLDSNGTIRNSYATGSVPTGGYAFCAPGGNPSTVEDCYYAGSEATSLVANGTATNTAQSTGWSTYAASGVLRGVAPFNRDTNYVWYTTNGPNTPYTNNAVAVNFDISGEGTVTITVGNQAPFDISQNTVVYVNPVETLAMTATEGYLTKFYGWYLNGGPISYANSWTVDTSGQDITIGARFPDAVRITVDCNAQPVGYAVRLTKAGNGYVDISGGTTQAFKYFLTAGEFTVSDISSNITLGKETLSWLNYYDSAGRIENTPSGSSFPKTYGVSIDALTSKAYVITPQVTTAPQIIVTRAGNEAVAVGSIGGRDATSIYMSQLAPPSTQFVYYYYTGETITLGYFGARDDSYFDGWYLNDVLDGSANQYEHTVTADATLAANSSPKVIVTLEIVGTGTVTISGDVDTGYADLGNNRYAYYPNATVMFTATGDINNKFSKWTNGQNLLSDTTSIQLDITADITVTATFLPMRTLMLEQLGAGAILVDGETVTTVDGQTYTYTYASGTPITIEVIPATNYSFTGWSGLQPVGWDSTSAGPQIFTITDDIDMKASLLQGAPIGSYTLTVKLIGRGSFTTQKGDFSGVNTGSSSITFSKEYANGTTAVIIPTAAQGWKYKSTETVAVKKPVGPKPPPTPANSTPVVVDSNKLVTITFEPDTAPPTPVPCFLADAPVLTPTGYRRIGEIEAGDEVVTGDGRTVAVQFVKRVATLAGPATNPYVIPRGRYGARQRLLISPGHRVQLADGTLAEASTLGLRQEEMRGVFEYFNLELPNWQRDTMVVAGVTVESMAPVRRVIVSMETFLAGLRAQYGAITPALLERARRSVRVLADGKVEMPVLPKPKGA